MLAVDHVDLLSPCVYDEESMINTYSYLFLLSIEVFRVPIDLPMDPYLRSYSTFGFNEA